MTSIRCAKVQPSLPRRRLSALVSDEAGEVAVSYALIAALISIAAIIGFNKLGNSSGELFQRIASVIGT